MPYNEFIKESKNASVSEEQIKDLIYAIWGRKLEISFDRTNRNWW